MLVVWVRSQNLPGWIGLRAILRQRFVLFVSYVVCSTIGYHSNSWASCFSCGVLCCFVLSCVDRDSFHENVHSANERRAMSSQRAVCYYRNEISRHWLRHSGNGRGILVLNWYYICHIIMSSCAPCSLGPSGGSTLEQGAQLHPQFLALHLVSNDNVRERLVEKPRF